MNFNLFWASFLYLALGSKNFGMTRFKIGLYSSADESHAECLCHKTSTQDEKKQILFILSDYQGVLIMQPPGPP